MSNETTKDLEPLSVGVTVLLPENDEGCWALAAVELDDADLDNRQLILTPLGDPEAVVAITFSDAAARELCAQLLGGAS